MNKFYDNKHRANMSILTKLYNIYDKQQTQIKSNIFSFWKFRTTNPNIPLILKEYNNNDYINIYTKNSNANEDNNNNLYLHTNNSYNSTPALFNHKQLQLQQQQQQRCLIDSNGTNSSSRIESFLQRQENFISAKNKRLENRMKLSEKKLNALYTFSPHLSSYIKHNHSDSIKPKHTNNNKLKEDLLSTHNPKINKKIYEYIYKTNNPKQKVKQIDKHQIEKLYNDYHQRQSRRRLLIEKIDNEDGITFKPHVNTSPSYFKKQDTFNIDIPNTNTNKTQRNIMTYDYYKEMELMELRHNSLSKYIQYTNSK